MLKSPCAPENPTHNNVSRFLTSNLSKCILNGTEVAPKEKLFTSFCQLFQKHNT